MFKETPLPCPLLEASKKAALRGLDFFVRNQIDNCDSADKGRFPFFYNCDTNQTEGLTTNWVTGVIVSALLAGYKSTGNNDYLAAAKAGCAYIKGLQDFNPGTPRLQGVFHEETPQSPQAHPRDALTAAWALLDCSLITGDQDGINRAIAYGNWFVETALEKGYPYWTVRFDDQAWEPNWCGSFHSGSAFFMYRLYTETGEEKFLLAMRTILDFYNLHHLDNEGNITVIIDRESLENLDGKGDPRFTYPGWEAMHRYNDDFGALANLAAWKTTGEEAYRNSATRFFDRMCVSQHRNGGFGPEEWSVPSAGGAIVMEMLAAKQLGISSPEYDEAVEKAIHYLLALQKTDPDSPSDGAFFGMTEDYGLSDTRANARTAGYAIMALLRYAGATDDIYFFQPVENTQKRAAPVGVGA